MLIQRPLTYKDSILTQCKQDKHFFRLNYHSTPIERKPVQIIGDYRKYYINIGDQMLMEKKTEEKMI